MMAPPCARTVAPAGSGGRPVPDRATQASPLPCRADPDGLDVLELVHAELGELSAEARALDASEGEPRVRGHHAVNEDEPRLDPRGDALPALDVAGPDVGAQTVLGVVGVRDRLLLVTHPDDRSHRAESLLPDDRHVAGHLGPHRRPVVDAGPALS